MPRRTDSIAARRAEIVGMLQRMPTRWRRAYNTARRTLADNGGPVLPNAPTPEQAMLILANTAGGNRDIDRPTGDQRVPQGVRDEAMHGLRLSFSEDYPGWEFFGIARAIQLALAPGVPMRTRERMKRYLTAHEKDKRAPGFGDEERPSKGYMAWLNWGGDAGLEWNEDVARATYSARTRGQRANPVSEDFKAGPAEDIEFSRALLSKVFVENPRRNPLTPLRRNGFVDYMKGVEERGKSKGRAERAVGTAQTAAAVATVGAKAAPKVAAKVAAKVGAKAGARAIPVVGQALMVVGGGKELAKAGYRHYKQGFDRRALKTDVAKVGAGILGVEDFVPDYKRPAKRAKRNPRDAFGPKKPLFGPYTYRVKQNSNGDTLIAVYHGSKRIAHIDAFWAYSMRVIEEHEEDEARRGTRRRLVCATDLRALGAEGKYPNVLAVGHAFMDDEAYKGKGIGRAMYEAMMVEGFAVRQTRIGGQPGPMFFIPDECKGSGNTSAEAQRVWASLARDYPSQGTSIRVDAPPVIGSRAKANPRPTTAERTDPALWEAVKREVTAGSKGGVRGEWSARKAQLAVALYKKRGGDYLGPKSPQNALTKWTQEEWRTRSGEPSLVTGERYLPARAIEALTPAEYAATTRAKRAGLRRDEQFTRQPEGVARKTARYRKNPDLRGSVTANLRPDTVAVVAFWSPKDSNWLRKQFADMGAARQFFAKVEQSPAARYVPSQLYVVGEE